jgi:hypothetical protein
MKLAKLRMKSELMRLPALVMRLMAEMLNVSDLS